MAIVAKADAREVAEVETVVCDDCKGEYRRDHGAFVYAVYRDGPRLVRLTVTACSLDCILARMRAGRVPAEIQF